MLRRNGLGDWGSIAASTGNVTIDGVKAIGVSTMGSGYPAVLALSGTVHATMTPGNIADYADQLPPAGQGVSIYATLAGKRLAHGQRRRSSAAWRSAAPTA